MNDPFAHLHVHSAHSVLDGLGRLADICDSAASDPAWAAAGMQPAIAITDHGNLSGTWRFAKLARSRGVKPILGCEFYVAIGSRHDKNSIEVAADDLDLDSGASDKVEGRKKQKRYEHITVIAINETGWRNLVTLNNIAQDPETAWHKPRIDLELLCEYNEGLVVFTGCLGGPIAGSLARGDNKRAHEIMVMLHDAFSDGQKDPSKKRLFVEVMEHGIELERTLMPKLLRLAKEFNVEVVATNDAHFVEPEHHHHHDAWLCTNTKKTLSDPNRWRFNGEGYHLRSAAEMRRLFDDQNGTGRAVSNSLLIAEMAEEEVIPGSDLRIPEFEPPAGWEPSDRAVAKGFDGSKAYLYDKVWEGALLRYDPKGLLGGDLPSEVKKRLAFEFKTITGMNLHNYFLIVEDLISWARANGIRVGPGRGSAAGCAISYCLGIVQVEPIANGLLFERFLNTERAGMPDIDIDFDAEGRDRVFTYLTQRWGADRVARLGTFGVTLSKGAIRAAARVLDLDAAGETLSRAVPIDTGGKPMAFAKMLDESNPAGADFRRRVDTSDDTRDVVDLAVGFENVIDKEGIHACGVVVSDESLLALVPYRYTKDGQKVTQWDGKDIDEANFLKIDALSLRNLDIVSATVRMIEESTGEDLNERRVLGTDENGQPILGLAKIDSPPVDPNDPELSEVEKERCRAAWKIVSEGRTAGLFQLESPGMTQLCMDIRAENLNDLSAIVALYRPGPLGEKMHERYAQRKHGHEPVDYGIFTAGSPSEEAEQEVIAEVLGETFGVPVYQEQLMQLGEVVAGFGPAEKNRLRKAVSKKIKAEMAEVGRIFVEGATSEFTDEDGTVTKIAFAEETAARLWDAMKSAGDYSFNKAHSFAYGWLGYITAYLKANWPTQYGAALLSVTTKSDKRLAVLTSLRDEGIVISPPCVNESMIHTSVIDGRVVIGLSEIRDVGLTDAEAIIAARSDGPFKSLADLVARTSPEGSRLVKTNAIEGLIEAGAFDNIAPEPEEGTRRLGLATIARAVLDHPDLEVPDMEWGVLKKARLERHRLGVLLSQHPLETEVLTKAREFDAELDAEVAAANAKISSDDPFDDYADQAERVDRFGGQLRYASDRGIKARSLRKVVAETTTAPVITIGLVAQWAEKSGAWGRRASFVLDSENAWISGVAWSDTVDLAEKTGNIPEVGDVVVVSGLRKLRRPPQDNSGDPGAVEAEASIERPELTAYVINRAVIEDDDFIGLAPYDLGLAQTAPSDEEIEELIASITPVEEPAPESDPDKPTLFDQLAEPVAEPSDDSVSTDDQVSTDDPFAAEDDPFAEPDLAPAAETDDPFDGPFADPFADPEDGESEQVEDASHVESEPEFEPVGSEEKEDEDEVESDLEPVAEVSEHRRPVMSVVPPLPDTDDDGSDDTDDSGAEASDTSPSVFDAPPGRDHVIAGHTVGRRFAESDLIAEHWNGHTDIVVIELDLAAGEILSKTLYRAITETRPRVEPFLHAAKEWVINRRSCDVTHIRLLERLQKMSRGEPVVVRTKRPGLVQETWFVAPEEVEGAAAYRHLVALVGEMEAGEPKHASHIA